MGKLGEIGEVVAALKTLMQEPEDRLGPRRVRDLFSLHRLVGTRWADGHQLAQASQGFVLVALLGGNPLGGPKPVGKKWFAT